MTIYSFYKMEEEKIIKLIEEYSSSIFSREDIIKLIKDTLNDETISCQSSEKDGTIIIKVERDEPPYFGMWIKCDKVVDGMGNVYYKFGQEEKKMNTELIDMENNDNIVLGKETRDYPVYMGTELFRTLRFTIEGPKDELEAYKDYPFDSIKEGGTRYYIDKNGCIEKVEWEGYDMTQEPYCVALFNEKFPKKPPQQIVEENYHEILSTIKRLETTNQRRRRRRLQEKNIV